MTIADTVSRTLPAKSLAVFIPLWIGISALSAADRPLKVFILAGQSNMEGHARIETFDYIGDDPATAPLLKRMRDADGKPAVCDHVWISYFTGTGESNGEGFGKLTAGYGSRQNPTEDGGKIGPEFTFGLTLDERLKEPVLIIKTAWGGKSLHTDFRPPSAGPYVLSDWQKENYPKQQGHGIPKDFEKWKSDKVNETGVYYRLMIEHVKRVLADPKRVCPAYDPAAGYEIAGFVWLQGWNDMVDGHTYPAHGKPGRYDLYSECLSHFIRDVRRDLGVADLPVVVGELTGPWVDAPGEWKALREAQAAAVRRDEWKGRVVFVPTAAFVRKPEDSPHPTHAHHEFGNADTYVLVGNALGQAMRSLVVSGSPALGPAAPDARIHLQNGDLSGYMLVPLERVPREFNAGFSLYAAAWPIVEVYPGSRFQTGLFGTWMFAQFEGEPPKDLYSDIEGGLGWWRDTRFATTTPKFIMGGVAPNFSSWANGPGAGKGRDWDRPLGKFAVAQLSPWVVWPPDGLNLAQGTCGELFGYGYVPLPLIDAKPTTAGATIPTGDQCWTLFLNTANFKGPLCFFTPYFWSASAVERPELAGMLLDSRPSDPNKAFQMETQWVPAMLGTVASDTDDLKTFARTAPMSFPVDHEGRTVVLHRLTTYTPEALTEPVRRWFAGGAAASGAIDPAASHVQQFIDGGGSTWQIAPEGTHDDEKHDIIWSIFGTPTAHDPMTFGYRWNRTIVRPVDDDAGSRVRLPEYFRLDETEGKPRNWVPVAPTEVPVETGLHALRFETPREEGDGAYVTPEGPESPFRSPGPVAGPFEITLGDGSTVTYAWYRFADQPAMLHADLSPAQRDVVQRRVEMLHRAWTRDQTYLAPPTTGSLASIDPALIVEPPPGLEIGYVPIALRQERRSKR